MDERLMGGLQWRSDDQLVTAERLRRGVAIRVGTGTAYIGNDMTTAEAASLARFIVDCGVAEAAESDGSTETPVAAVRVPNPHNGSRCEASADGSVGFYSVEVVEDGVSEVVCPNGCGWWRTFDPSTGEVLDGSHGPLSADSVEAGRG